MEIRYCTSAGGRRKKFELLFPYLNDDEIAVTVVFEQRSSGSWKPIKAIIDEEESTADIDDAMVDLEDLWWFMFPKNETNRVLPPVIASWEIDNWIILACLNERYQIKHSRITDNKDREIISDRILCWWPDPATWKTNKSLFKSIDTKEIVLPFYTFREYFSRPDNMKMLEQDMEMLRNEFPDKEEFNEAVGFIKTYEYARYIRNLRTSLLFCRKNNIPVKLTLGSVKQAVEYFKKENLDPYDSVSWARVATIFEPMPDVVIEEQTEKSLVAIKPNEKIKATLNWLSHMPALSPVPDAIGVSIHTNKQHITDIVFYFNPLKIDVESKEKQVEIVVDKLSEYGVNEIYATDEIQPFESRLDADGLMLKSTGI